MAAARAAKLSHVSTMMYEFDSEQEALEYAIRCQRNRRNLTAAEIVQCVAELDKRRKPEFHGNQHAPSGEASRDASPGKSSKETADLLGVSQATVERARAINDHAPEEVREAVRNGLGIKPAYEQTQAARREAGEIPALAVKRMDTETTIPLLKIYH